MRKQSLLVAVLMCCAVGSIAQACTGGTSASVSSTDPAGSTTTIVLPPAAWRGLAPSGDRPSPCFGATLVCLPSDGRFFLFGGWTGGAIYLNNTWVYDPAANAWTDLNPTGIRPAPRASHTMAYDPGSNRMILFGGFDGVSYYNDTWAYDPAANAWANLSPSGSVPAARAGHSLVYDPGSTRMILFGGSNGRTEYQDTWAYDPARNSWTNLRPDGPAPAPRDSQAMAYDPINKVMILFGGWSTTTEFCDTWAYDPAGNTWTDLDLAAGLPSPRALQQMIYDPSVHQMVMFGGGTGTKVLDDTWHFDFAGKTWSQTDLTEGPPPARAGYALAYDSAGRRVGAVLFGGSNGSTFFNDLWIMEH